MPKNYQRGFSPILVVAIVALVIGAVVVKAKLENKSNKSTTPVPTYSASPTPVSKVDTTNSKDITPATQSAKPAIEAMVASYASCTKYDGPTAVAYPPFPATGPAGTTVLLFASGQVDASSGDSLAGYDWDFEGDGKWDATVGPIGVQHVYPQAGSFKPKFRVRTAQGKVSNGCEYPHPVMIDQGKPTSNPISVNRSDINVTLYRSNPNTTLMMQDNASYTDNDLYGEGFTVSLHKATGWQLINIGGSSEVYFDQTEKMGAVGEAFKVHVIAPKTVANGTYQLSGKLQYFQDGLWHPYTTVNLTVTIAD